MKTVAIFFSLFVGASSLHAQNFGVEGQQGREGRDGYPGPSGRDVTVFANGSGEYIDVGGERGTDATDGETGFDATQCVQPASGPSNAWPAEGGRGGSGGGGGVGGSGGKVIIHYDTLENLRRIYVNNVGGPGGRGGRGGYGGRSCTCQTPQWTYEGQTYFCYQARDGETGYQGSNGANGSYGSLVLIPTLGPVAQDQPSVNIVMSKIEDAPVNLFSNIWQRRTGARSLLASGSTVHGEYLFLADQKKNDVTFNWSATRSKQDFANRSLAIGLNANGVSVTLPSDVWADMAIDNTVPEKSTVEISGAVFTADLNQIGFTDLVGSGKSLQAIVTDRKDVADDNKVETSFSVQYYTLQGRRYYLRHEAALPVNLVQKSGGLYSLDIGQLNIADGYLAPGMTAFVRVYAKRKLGGKSASWYVEKTKRIQ